MPLTACDGEGPAGPLLGGNMLGGRILRGECPGGGGPRCRIVDGVVVPKNVGGEIRGGRGGVPETRSNFLDASRFIMIILAYKLLIQHFQNN